MFEELTYCFFYNYLNFHNLFYFYTLSIFVKYHVDCFEDNAIDIIYADVQDIKTISKMTQCASVIINCTGPYYIYGEVVVKSCVLNSTHYVDVTGESLVS